MARSPKVTERPPLEELFKRAKQWIVEETGEFKACFDSKDWGYRWCVSEEELQQVHHLLPAIIRHQSAEKHWMTGEPATNGSVVRDHLAFLTGKTLTFYEYVYGTHILTNIIDIKPYKNDESWIQLSATRFKFSKIQGYGPQIPIIESKETRDFMFQKDYLERDYPGWEQRWQIGADLGLTGGALVEYCFKPDTTPSADLGDFSFESVK